MLMTTWTSTELSTSAQFTDTARAARTNLAIVKATTARQSQIITGGSRHWRSNEVLEAIENNVKLEPLIQKLRERTAELKPGTGHTRPIGRCSGDYNKAG